MKGLAIEMKKYNTQVSYAIVNQRVSIGRDIKRACETPKQKLGGDGSCKGKGKHQREYDEFPGEKVVSSKLYCYRRSMGWNKLRAYTTPRRNYPCGQV